MQWIHSSAKYNCETFNGFHSSTKIEKQFTVDSAQHFEAFHGRSWIVYTYWIQFSTISRIKRKSAEECIGICVAVEHFGQIIEKWNCTDSDPWAEFDKMESVAVKNWEREQSEEFDDRTEESAHNSGEKCWDWNPKWNSKQSVAIHKCNLHFWDIAVFGMIGRSWLNCDSTNEFYCWDRDIKHNLYNLNHCRFKIIQLSIKSFNRNSNMKWQFVNSDRNMPFSLEKEEDYSWKWFVHSDWKKSHHRNVELDSPWIVGYIMRTLDGFAEKGSYHQNLTTILRHEKITRIDNSFEITRKMGTEAH
jgi:hypothetical protein